ncbi:helix-turn-helix domain-containing protein [Gorillibacterium sp. CAU 1737]|uniref:helix-turn-helix domain-containing protein n=1 Tax=Gorillibacterium sp. CAU 1737 TaxID=3140362 RepID=UPI0032607758
MNEKQKYQIIMQGIKSKNISRVCKEYGISRTLYYRWNKEYREHGMKGLAAKERKPRMPNRADRPTEKRILQHAAKYPQDGPKRIFYELRDEGYPLGESGVYNVLKRNGLSTRKEREAFSEGSKGRQGNRRVLSRSEVPSTQSGRIKQLEFGLKQPENARPGYLCLQSIHNMGRFPKIGMVYLYTLFDVHSRLALVKLYPRKDSIQVKDFMETKVLPLLKTFQFRIEHLVTNRSREFMTHWERGTHSYSAFLSSHGIIQIGVPASREEMFRPIHQFTALVAKDYFQQAWSNETLTSFDELERGLKEFLVEYNFTREIKDGPNRGRTPADVALATVGQQEPLPLWVFTRR